MNPQLWIIDKNMYCWTAMTISPTIIIMTIFIFLHFLKLKLEDENAREEMQMWCRRQSVLRLFQHAAASLRLSYILAVLLAIFRKFVRCHTGSPRTQVTQVNTREFHHTSDKSLEDNWSKSSDFTGKMTRILVGEHFL